MKRTEGGLLRDHSDGDAWTDGYRAGSVDAFLEVRNGYAGVVEETPGYPRDYSRGYRTGWLAARRIERR